MPEMLRSPGRWALTGSCSARCGGDVEAVDLLWLPLGAGSRTPIVRASGWTFERLAARRSGRRPCALFHAALEVHHDGARWTIEMTPRWATPAGERGVTVTGPVFLEALGWSRFFQYEVRRWRDGVIPDRAFAVGRPKRLSSNGAQAEQLLDAVPRVPPLVWGRDALHTGEMWNSNSIVAWLLAVSGHDAATLQPPSGGRAPGWSAGVVASAARGL